MKRVVLTALLAVPEFLLDPNPLAGHPSGILAESVRESDSFRKELTESQFFQRRKYPRNIENATSPTPNVTKR